jgi:hypothetical protein
MSLHTPENAPAFSVPSQEGTRMTKWIVENHKPYNENPLLRGVVLSPTKGDLGVCSLR